MSGDVAATDVVCAYLDVRGLQGFYDTLKVGLLVFLELWLGIASLELWLRMVDEHEELLSCGSGWRLLSV
ncbi:hypothetical protein DEO72_LG5g996 [Vigna unguiculata]|uniref:Uncharacterized protein n=1 Tax=Vigna unguiculata TaxID=3917 RepID=A0A4D6LW76_VIGUN|nr:hypothetical protein DEO72_LG5g996 [Vigna unguiculata]